MCSLYAVLIIKETGKDTSDLDRQERGNQFLAPKNTCLYLKE